MSLRNATLLRRRSAVCLLGVFAVATTVGCKSSGEEASFLPSPELQTLHKTTGQNIAKSRLYGDLGKRLMLEDVAAWFHFDRPTRLTRSPMPY